MGDMSNEILDEDCQRHVASFWVPEPWTRSRKAVLRRLFLMTRVFMSDPEDRWQTTDMHNDGIVYSFEFDDDDERALYEDDSEFDDEEDEEDLSFSSCDSDSEGEMSAYGGDGNGNDDEDPVIQIVGAAAAGPSDGGDNKDDEDAKL
ncbi:hypothetical protein SCUCBS95973_008679 [Sporothrix curviconia]|uniref:Uncharacterized protein n=1 Tax=Sporothrix curviconia TaxID=1260050 RepID=A0ABP0CQ25_9PEZI